MTFDLAGMSQKVKADCLDLAVEVLDAAKAEIIRLTARVAELEAALGFYADNANWCARIAVNGPGDIDLKDPVMSGDDHGNTARAALSTPTEEPKT